MDKKYIFREHIPASAYCGQEYGKVEYSTQEELMNHELVARFHRNYPDKKFHQFAIITKEPGEWDTLMVQHDEGRHWWCVGFLKKPHPIKLPEQEIVKET